MEMTGTSLCEEVIIAGFGGQGIILAGKLFAQTAMKAGKEVTYMPAYGAEVRGGTSNCMIMIADEPIASPMVTNPDSLIAMNKASFYKFTPQLKEGGLLVMNRSSIDVEVERDDIDVLAVPADEIAIKLGNQKIANMVALGAYLQKRHYFTQELAAKYLVDVLAERYHSMIPINTQAIEQGSAFARDSSG